MELNHFFVSINAINIPLLRSSAFTSFSTGAIWGYFNEVNVAPWTIPVPSPSAPLPGYFGDNVDVAAYTDKVTGQQGVVLAYLNGTNSLWYREYNVSTAGVFPPNLLQTATNIWMSRVEAMSLYTAGTGAKWQIAALVNSNVKGYNDLNPTGFVVADAWDYYLPAVGCAVGKLSPAPNNVGNENYLIGFHAAASDNFVRNVDVSSGLIPNNDWYQVNSGFVNYAAYTSMFAISSSSNSGNGILTAWFDGNDIIYKESPNFIQFRTTGVNNTGRLAAAITTYPNPAREKLYVNGAGNTSSYTITSLSGATVSSGMYRENGIDIRALPAGMYILQLRENEQTRSVTFTKS